MKIKRHIILLLVLLLIIISPCQNVKAADTAQVLETYHVDVPSDVMGYCETAGYKYDIPPELLEAIAWRESRYQADAKNGSCVGMMQVSTKFHTGRAESIGVDNIQDPEGNIEVAANYLNELYHTYDTTEMVLMVYNGDSNAGKKGYVSKYARDIETVADALLVAHGKKT